MSTSPIASIYPKPEFEKDAREDLTRMARSWFLSNTRKEINSIAKDVVVTIAVYSNYLCVILNKGDVETIATFYLTDTPGCCGILISNYTHVQYGYRNNKISYLLQDMKTYLANKLHVGMLMATVVSTNTPEQISLAKTGWHKVNTFDNPGTGNSVDVWVKNRSSFVNPDYVVKSE